MLLNKEIRSWNRNIHYDFMSICNHGSCKVILVSSQWNFHVDLASVWKFIFLESRNDIALTWNRNQTRSLWRLMLETRKHNTLPLKKILRLSLFLDQFLLCYHRFPTNFSNVVWKNIELLRNIKSRLHDFKSSFYSALVACKRGHIKLEKLM